MKEVGNRGDELKIAPMDPITSKKARIESRRCHLAAGATVPDNDAVFGAFADVLDPASRAFAAEDRVHPGTGRGDLADVSCNVVTGGAGVRELGRGADGDGSTPLLGDEVIAVAGRVLAAEGSTIDSSGGFFNIICEGGPIGGFAFEILHALLEDGGVEVANGVFDVLSNGSASCETDNGEANGNDFDESEHDV